MAHPAQELIYDDNTDILMQEHFELLQATEIPAWKQEELLTEYFGLLQEFNGELPIELHSELLQEIEVLRGPAEVWWAGFLSYPTLIEPTAPHIELGAGLETKWRDAHGSPASDGAHQRFCGWQQDLLTAGACPW